MKKTNFGAVNYSVAMSQDTGCIVMVKIDCGKQKVMGSLTREQSIEFAKSIVAWAEVAQVEEAVKEAVKPKLSIVN